jgi:DNA replication protein DnaC
MSGELRLGTSRSTKVCQDSSVCRGAELLFQVLTEREEKNSVAIASNESFSGWTKTFTDPRLCAAIVDRLTFNGAIIQTGTESYRLAHTKAQAERAEAN